MNLLIPILAGSEVRQFLLSGIVSDLIESGHSVYVTIKDDDADLIREVLSIEARIVVLSYIRQAINGSIVSYVREILDYHYDKINDRWRYSSPTKNSRLKSFVYGAISLALRLKIIRSLFEKFEQYLMRSFDVSKVILLLSESSIDTVIVSNARFLFYPDLLIAAQQENIPVKVVYHSNKEVFAQPRLSFKYSKYGVWNVEMEEALLAKYPELESKISIVGNTHFSYLAREQGTMPSEEFSELFGLQQPDSFVLLYTAAGIIVRNETLIVQRLSEILKKLGSSYKIIVRRNPMDTTSQWEDFFKGREDVVVQHPKWCMDNELGLNYTYKEDLREYTALLHYADCCVNLPSTVTVEAAIKHKPVINICYEFPGVDVSTNNGSLSQFWTAPFYRVFHTFDFVIPAMNDAGLVSALEECVVRRKQFLDYDRCVEAVLSNRVDQINKKVISFILEGS